ncbi:MAG: polynucleotide adenylyltransferase PcnB [Gammaproteobacteria bacterium]|nr:polynucleotide adenylyltransferase PcnB [Gammaproteobacteria bacterium]
MNTLAALPGADQAKIVERDQHCISRHNISPNALKVLYALRDAGFYAFLVGGGVRDLLLGGTPKDFDIATDATPEQLKKVFRNARIIGRRFKIVHIHFGREIIEVTTFRAHHEQQNEIADDVSRRQIQGLDSAHSTGGMLLRDNVYGTIDADALRRDFTVNALYYTIDRFQVLDFCNGLDDLQSKQIRIIGDARERYKEDPVRMLRALRFAAKLRFEIEANTRAPIDELAHLLESISPARLFDETIKLFTSGNSLETFKLLKEFRVGRYLFAPTMEVLELARADEPANRLIDLALINTDNRLAEGKSITPAFLFAAFLWPVLQKRVARSSNQAAQEQPALLQQCADAVIHEQLQYTAIPKRFTIATKEIWELQARLQRTNKRSIASAFSHPRFRAAYDFLLLREESGEDLQGIGQWWTNYQLGDTAQQTKMTGTLADVKKRRRRGSKRKPAATLERTLERTPERKPE